MSFHDIGYPVSYYFSIKDRILDFIPTFHALISDSNFDFNYVNSVLEESILFQFVGKDEIKRRFEENDHGVISAILMAIYFYKTGKIYSLPIEQKVAVEIGVLAIYNHTLSFGYCYDKSSKKSGKTEYYKMQFSLNPISYLLRLCDDSQEWDREYFEIKSISNLLFCPSCKMPLRREVITYDEYLKSNRIDFKETISDNEKMCYRYWCFCKSKKITKKDDFTRRKLVNIKACKEVIVTFDEQNKFIEFNFRYDNFKLLRLCTLHLTFTDYRCKEMMCLKKFVEKQSFTIEQEGYNAIFIKHNLTPNPMLLKTFILRNYFVELEKIKSSKKAEKDLAFLYKRLLEKKPDEVINNGQEELLKDLAQRIVVLCYAKGNKKNPSLFDIASKNCKYYLLLMLVEHYVVKLGVENLALKEYCCWLEQMIANSFKDDIRSELYCKAIERLKDSYAIPDFEVIGDDKYIRYLKEDKKMYLDVEFYCNNNYNVNKEENVKKELLSYYTDLYLYEKLNEITEVMKK